MTTFSALRKIAPKTNLIEDGVWLHLRHWEVPPGEEEAPLLYADPVKNEYPVRVKVRSALSKTFRAKELRMTTEAQARLSRMKVKDREKAMQEAVQVERAHRFSWLVAAVENMDLDNLGQMQIPEEEDLFAIAVLTTKDEDNLIWFVDQAMAHAYENSNYGVAATEGNAPAAGEKTGGEASNGSSSSSRRPPKTAS